MIFKNMNLKLAIRIESLIFFRRVLKRSFITIFSQPFALKKGTLNNANILIVGLCRIAFISFTCIEKNVRQHVS